MVHAAEYSEPVSVRRSAPMLLPGCPAKDTLLVDCQHLWLNDVEETNADVRIPSHRKRPTNVVVFSSATRNRALRKSKRGGESVFILEWRLSLIGSCRADGDGSSINRIKVAFMPGPIAKGITRAGSVAGDVAYESHSDLTYGLSASILFLAVKNVRVVGVSHTSAEVKNKREALMCLSLGTRRRDPKQHETYHNE